MPYMSITLYTLIMNLLLYSICMSFLKFLKTQIRHHLESIVIIRLIVRDIVHQDFFIDSLFPMSINMDISIYILLEKVSAFYLE